MPSLPKMTTSVFALGVCCIAMLATLSAQTFHRVHGFNKTDGQDPIGLVQGTDGSLWVNTQDGGAIGYGAVFNIATSGKMTTVHSFCSETLCADGSYPQGSLIQSTDGNFYGVTNAGGAGGQGTIFKLTPRGKLTTLYSFCSSGYPVCPNGYGPVAGLVRASNGSFYGTTQAGGDFPYCGTVFKISAMGKLTRLHSFNDGTDGCYPEAALIQASDGNLYGTTKGGSGAGTVFRVTQGGTVTTVYSFCSLSDCLDGKFPEAGLVQGTDGNLYGTTNGQSGPTYGTVFKITLDGVLTTLHNFCSAANCADGAYPQSGVVQASDGNFYGTNTGLGGGTIFEITLDGTLSTLYTFCQQKGCLDGFGPDALILSNTNGTLYGLTRSGGLPGSCSGFGCGVIFTFTGLPLHP